MENSNSNNKEVMITLLIYIEDYKYKESYHPRKKPWGICEAPRDTPSAGPTSELGPPSEKPTKEPTSEPKYDTSSEYYEPTKEGFMGQIYPGYIVRYRRGEDQPWFDTLEERSKEASWGDIWKIQILVQEETLEAVEDLLTPTKIPSQLPTSEC